MGPCGTNEIQECQVQGVTLVTAIPGMCTDWVKCSLVSNDRICRDGIKLHQERFKLIFRKNIFYYEDNKRLPREMDDAPRLSVFKRHLDNAANSMLQLLVSSEMVMHLDLMFSEGSFQLNYSIPFHARSIKGPWQLISGTGNSRHWHSRKE